MRGLVPTACPRYPWARTMPTRPSGSPSSHLRTRRRLSAWVDDYNHRRAHMGIDGLTPADRFFGRADQVLARIDAISRGRIAASATRNGGPAAPVEETISASSGAPLEVLRLVILDGVMEMRFCGARVQLGPVMT